MTTFHRAMVATVVTLLLATPFAAQEKVRSPEAEKVLQALVGLPHKKHMDTLAELGVTPGAGFLDCVCHDAGYGSSSTAQFYHPDTIGEFNKAYSCTQPGEPCIVSGFGCGRYPLPSNPAIWESCARAHPGEDGANLIDKILKEINKRGDKPAHDYLKDLDQCRANWSATLIDNPAMTKAAGLKYLAAEGVPLLPPPSRIAEKLKADAGAEAAKLAEKLKAAAVKVDKDWKQLAAEKAYEDIVKKPETYKAAADMATAVIEQELKELAIQSKDRTAAWKKLSEGGISGNELNYKHEIYRADMAKLDAHKKALEREKLDFKVISGLAETYKDIVGAKKAIENLASPDARKQLTGFADATGTLKKYLDKFTGWSTQDLESLAKKVKSKGLTDKQFAALQELTTQKAALSGLSTAMDYTAKATKMTIQGYDIYRVYMDGLDKADALAKKGNYTEAQRQLLGAFKGMEKLAALGGKYLPPGISEMMSYYEEAMKTPAKFDAFIREVANMHDEFADIKGDQAQIPVMQAYNSIHGGSSLNRDGYLYRIAGLQAYRMDPKVGNHAFVLMPKADGQPIFLDEANYNKLAEAAWLYPIVERKRMSDADILALIGTGTDNPTLNIDALKQKGEAKLKEAAENQKIADMFGQKTISTSDKTLWTEFQTEMTKALPALCVLDSKRQKALFSSFRDPAQRDGVLQDLKRYGESLKAVAADRDKKAKAKSGN